MKSDILISLLIKFMIKMLSITKILYILTNYNLCNCLLKCHVALETAMAKGPQVEILIQISIFVSSLPVKSENIGRLGPIKAAESNQPEELKKSVSGWNQARILPGSLQARKGRRAHQDTIKAHFPKHNLASNRSSQKPQRRRATPWISTTT